MRQVKDITKEELFHLAELASNGYCSSESASNIREVECGGNGNRRRVEWNDFEPIGTIYNFFEVSSEFGDNWQFYCKSGHLIDTVTKQPKFESLCVLSNVAAIVDYCRERELDICKARVFGKREKC